MKKVSSTLLIFIFAVFLASGSVMSDVIDLTDTSNPSIHTGISGSDGSIWKVIQTDPTGTGVYQPFLRYQDDPVEIGMNTDLKPPPYDDKMPAGKYTRSVLFSDLGAVVVSGSDYWAFTIDFNEPGNNNRFLSFDIFDIYEGSVPNAGSISGLIPLWNSGDTVLTDYTLASSGSGKDDIEFLIPVQPHTQDYMYLYIRSGEYNPGLSDVGYGRDWEANGGFEEIRTTGIPPVPEPATMLLLGTGLIALAGFGRKKIFK